jgi:predicted Zn-dependent protease
MKSVVLGLSAAFMVSVAAPAHAQFGGFGKIKDSVDKAKQVKDIHINEQQERQIGEQTSLSLRTRFGVVQDQNVTRYVTLVGSALAQASDRPKLDWKFIILDTDAVNAFAAPGGFIHVTRGLLGFCKNEAELAGVLGHEITHVTAKHAVSFVEKSKSISIGTDAVAEKEGYTVELVAKASERIGHFLLDNEYSQANEDQADEVGAQLANKLGYDPHGLEDVLKRLDERNNSREEKNGMFSSHPATKDRITNVDRIITQHKLAGTATVEARYKENIPYEVKAIADIATDTSGASDLASGEKKNDDDKKGDDKKNDNGGKKGFGLSSLTGGGGNKQAQSNQQVASAGARGVGNPDRDAKGGRDPNVVNVSVTPADVDEFKKGIA